MIQQRLQDTDVYILREFQQTVGHLVQQPVTKVVQDEMLLLGQPFLQRLQHNGHDMQTCADLMRDTLGLPRRAVRKT